MLKLLNDRLNQLVSSSNKSNEMKTRFKIINERIRELNRNADKLFGDSFDNAKDKIKKLNIHLIQDEEDYNNTKVKYVNLIKSLSLSDEEKKELSYLISYYTLIPIVKPKTVSIDLSERCNLKCKICNQWKDRNPNKKIRFEDVKKIFNELSLFSPNTLVEFSGQEPLLKKELLIKSLEYGTKKNITMSINTNGILIKFFDIERLLKFKLNHITVSIDGFKDTHNYIRSSSTAFDKSIEALELLIKKKKELKLAKPTISVTSVITKSSYRELIKLHEFLGRLGVDTLNLNPFTLDNSYFFKKDATYENNEFWISDIVGLREVLEEMTKRKKEKVKPIITNTESQLRMIPNYFKSKGKYHKRICLAGLNYFHITNFGEISVCGKGPKLNIRDNDIETIWNNFNFLKTRLAVQNCSTPCLNNCFELK